MSENNSKCENIFRFYEKSSVSGVRTISGCHLWRGIFEACPLKRSNKMTIFHCWLLPAAFGALSRSVWSNLCRISFDLDVFSFCHTGSSYVKSCSCSLWSWQIYSIAESNRESGTTISAINWTHWGRVKIVAISQTTFSNTFSWTNMYEFRLKFLWNLILRCELRIFRIWLWKRHNNISH